jgi:hypothetical protein
MLNYRLAALLVLLTAVIVPMATHWMVAPGINWLKLYAIWGLFIIATWLWHRRRKLY